MCRVISTSEYKRVRYSLIAYPNTTANDKSPSLLSSKWALHFAIVKFTMSIKARPAYSVVGEEVFSDNKAASRDHSLVLVSLFRPKRVSNSKHRG